jgi:alkylhydroperoxidase family enzyme
MLPRPTPKLPAWATTLVVAQPKTTAGVLALDYVHRAKNPLGAELAARVRGAVAKTLRCEYAKAYAEADLKRALADAKTELPEEVSDDDESTLAFARKLTARGYAITDEETAALIKRLGPDKAVALVHTVAFANFHFRILQGLGVRVEPDGPYPPVELAYDPSLPALVDAPARPDWSTVANLKTKQDYQAPDEWKDISLADLETLLSQQKARKTRIEMPPDERFAQFTGELKRQTDVIVWMRVSMGYQPELTNAWFAAFRAFQQEGRTERVFSSSVFWVVTRANNCFY